MNEQRYNRLMRGEEELNEAEVAQGWHYCVEFDELLVGPGMGELRCCQCLPKDHPIYATTPPAEPVPPVSNINTYPPPTIGTPHQKLMAYMMGWMRGAGGGTFSGGLMEDTAEFQEGFKGGRAAKALAYAVAVKTYGATLNPIIPMLPGAPSVTPEGDEST